MTQTKAKPSANIQITGESKKEAVVHLAPHQFNWMSLHSPGLGRWDYIRLSDLGCAEAGGITAVGVSVGAVLERDPEGPQFKEKSS